jgi:hypothetical protein
VTQNATATVAKEHYRLQAPASLWHQLFPIEDARRRSPGVLLYVHAFLPAAIAAANRLICKMGQLPK